MSQDCCPAFRDGDTLVSVQQAVCGCETDVNCFFQEQCAVVCCLVQNFDVIPQYLVMVVQACSAIADFSSSPLLVAV